MNNMNSALDVQAISEALSDMEYFYYSEELLQMKWFSYYEELFIDISRMAAVLSDKLASLRNQIPTLYYNRVPDFNLASMLLSYSQMDYLIAADSGMSCDAAQYEQDNLDSFALCSKKEQRQLIVSVFEFLVEFQRLKAMYSTLTSLLQEFNYHNSGMEEFFQGGAE